MREAGSGCVKREGFGTLPLLAFQARISHLVTVYDSTVHTLRVLFALGPYAVSFLRDRRRWIWWGAPMPRSPEIHARRARRLVEAIIHLGPTFVKMAQVFAARADLIPEPYLSELGKLIDQVPPLSFDTVAGIIAASFHGNGPAAKSAVNGGASAIGAARVDEVFELFERTPVAAASLGQVHRARYNGEVVAVKVLRPGVEAAVTADLFAARRILSWVERYWHHPHVKRVRVVLDEFELRIAEEMDFRLEAEHAIEIAANFAGNRDVIVPKIVTELTRQRVIVMEFVEGTRIDRLDPARVNVPHIVATLVALYVQMMLVDGLFHADPHPGNLMVADDGRIVLLDFGMVVRVPLETRRSLMRTSIAAIKRDPAAVAAGFVALGLIIPGTPPETVQWLAQLLIENAYSRTTTRERIDALLADRVMKTLFDFPIVLPQHLVYFGRTAALIEGVGTRYDPYFQAIPIASPVILRMRSRILRSLGEPATPTVAEVATVTGYALGKAARWLVDLVGRPRTEDRGPTTENNGNHSTARMAVTNGKSVVKSSVKAIAMLLVCSIGAPRIAGAQAPAPAPLPSVDQQIAAAVLPLPAPMQAGATVMGYRTANKLEMLREGKNGMTCLALFAVEKNFHVACYHDGMEPFMARGRELRAQGVKDPKVDTVRFAEVASGKLKMPKMAALYQIFGKANSWDAATGKVSDASTLLVVYAPGATAESTGLSPVPTKVGPWIMYPGTPKAHIMISGAMAP
jgi:predicted unusual protein kinase regulating ubiquinone biosynthesis (AarF/ABC1/UbiB family)